jgi:predicted enzyme related to lactoylglutathione lyase
MADWRGRYLWYELHTTDPKAAQDFYTKLLGWGLETSSVAGIPYTMWTRGGTPIGGVMPLAAEARQAGVPSHWLTYIGTPDVDATVAQAKKKGAQVHVPPQDIPTQGRFAVLADPHGVMFAVYKPLREPAPPRAPELGDCTWHEIAAGDDKQAFEFFSSLFGWEKHGPGHDMGPLGKYQEYGLPGIPYPLGGIYKRPADMPAPPHIMLYFSVADVGPKAAQVKALGGQIVNGPMEVPGGDYIAICGDPQGAAFTLHHRKA